MYGPSARKRTKPWPFFEVVGEKSRLLFDLAELDPDLDLDPDPKENGMKNVSHKKYKIF
jgi:hypothetical protein